MLQIVKRAENVHKAIFLVRFAEESYYNPPMGDVNICLPFIFRPKGTNLHTIKHTIVYIKKKSLTNVFPQKAELPRTTSFTMSFQTAASQQMLGGWVLM